MRPMIVTFSGPTSPLPVDIYSIAGPAINLTVSGADAFNTIQATVRDPFDLTEMAKSSSWSTISGGLITTPYRAFRQSGTGQGVLIIVEQGLR